MRIEKHEVGQLMLGQGQSGEFLALELRNRGVPPERVSVLVYIGEHETLTGCWLPTNSQPTVSRQLTGEYTLRESVFHEYTRRGVGWLPPWVPTEKSVASERSSEKFLLADKSSD